MSVTNTTREARHLIAVTDLAAARVQLAILGRLAAGPAIPPELIDHLEEQDALHETSCDVYDLATRDLDAARKALTEAAAALTKAEEAWSNAGAEMNEAAGECVQGTRRGWSPPHHYRIRVGSAVTTGDQPTVLDALDTAAASLRDIAAHCPACDASPADLYDACDRRLARDAEFDLLAAKLRSEP